MNLHLFDTLRAHIYPILSISYDGESVLCFTYVISYLTSVPMDTDVNWKKDVVRVQLLSCLTSSPWSNYPSTPIRAITPCPFISITSFDDITLFRQHTFENIIKLFEFGRTRQVSRHPRNFTGIEYFRKKKNPIETISIDKNTRRRTDVLRRVNTLFSSIVFSFFFLLNVIFSHLCRFFFRFWLLIRHTVFSSYLLTENLHIRVLYPWNPNNQYLFPS